MKSIMVAPLALFASLALASISPAQAETRQERVAYGDLDLSAPSGVATLHGRITGAVRRVCASSGPLTPLVMECRSKARSDARTQMNIAIARAETRTNIQLASR